MDRVLSLFSLCRKAGKLAAGFDAAKEAMEKGLAAGVFVTADSSQKTKKEIRFWSSKYKIPYGEIAYTQEDVSFICQKKCGVLAVLDEGFYRQMEKLMKEDDARGHKI